MRGNTAIGLPMEAPGITRRRRPRRPFLAPLWVVALAVLAAAGLALLLVHFMGTTVVVVVHVPVEGSQSGDDPPSLSVQARARSLALMFGEPGARGSLEALYVSAAPGARETLAPLAERLGQQPVPVPAGLTPAAMASRMLREHSGASVLLVASGEQVPGVVAALSGSVVPGDADYIVSVPTIGQSNLVRFQY